MINDPIPFFEHWKGLPHQRAAVQQLWEAVPASLKKDDAAWYETWKAAGKQSEPRSLSNPLQVPCSALGWCHLHVIHGRQHRRDRRHRRCRRQRDHRPIAVEGERMGAAGAPGGASRIPQALS